MSNLSLKQKILSISFYETHKQRFERVERNSYYSYFDTLEKLYSLLDNEIYKAYFSTMSRNNWYEIARQKAFKEIVRAQTIDRYKKIDETAPTSMTEEEAREYSKTFFYEEARQRSQPYIPLQRSTIEASRQVVAQELARDNWKYDYTEVADIDFDTAAIEQAQAEMPEIVTAIRAALADSVTA